MRHLFLSVILLTTFLSTIPADAREDIYTYDAEAKTLKISSKNVDYEIPGVEAVWEDNIDAHTTKVTFQNKSVHFKREFNDLPFMPENPDEKFTAGRVEYDGFTHYFKKQRYEPSDGSVLERILDQYWEKIATETKKLTLDEVKVKFPSLDIQTRDICLGATSRKALGNTLIWSHTITQGDVYEKKEVAYRKTNAEQEPEEISSKGLGYFLKRDPGAAENIRESIPKRGEHCPSQIGLGSFHNDKCLLKFSPLVENSSPIEFVYETSQ